MYKKVLNDLTEYLKKENYMGYDLYDTLNSPFILKSFGNWLSILAIQFQKRNPINIRSFLLIKKEYNPKAMGLFLSAFSRLYRITKNPKYLKEADFFFNWLKNNYSEGYSGYAWGYNFPWASKDKYLERYSPTSVVTGFVCNGMYDYHSVTGNITALDIMKSAGEFLKKDIVKSTYNDKVCFSYTTQKADNCYNASLLAAQTFAQLYSITNEKQYYDLSTKALYYVISKQKPDGRWNYSIDEQNGKEREQIDFHQGYILNSIYKILKYCKILDPKVEQSLKKGLLFYKENQFYKNGVSLWRLPKIYPVDIHNQAQGIITFSYLQQYMDDGRDFAKVIADWTINNMFDKSGFFYFRKYRIFKNKISYTRWSQAWMLLALTYLLEE